MSESKFLPFQDADGDLQIDVCKDEKVIVEGQACPDKCTPDENAIVADWTTLSEPYLNEKICKYQIPISTNYSTTGYQSRMTEGEASNALQDIFNSNFKRLAIVDLLEFYNKEVTGDNIAFIQDSLENTSYDLQARTGSKLKLLYSVPFEVLDALEDVVEDEEEEEQDDAGDITITYQANELEQKILKVRKGLKLYNRYYRIFKNTTSEDKRILKYSGGGIEGKQFDLTDYGDFGLGINLGNKKAKLESVYSDLNKFFKDKGFVLKPRPGIFGLKDPVSELTLTFDNEYELKKLSFKTENCGAKPFVYRYNGKLKQLRKLDGWKDKTAVAYFAHLDEMEIDLTAREPKPWINFITQYTYPPVELQTPEQGLDGLGEAVGDALRGQTNSLVDNIFDDEFGIGDALAMKWYDAYCGATPSENSKFKVKLGINIRTDIFDNAKAALSEEELNSLVSLAESQSFGSLNEYFDPMGVICAAATSGDIEKTISSLQNLKKTGLNAVLMQAIFCFMKGLSFDDALESIISAALSQMNFDYLYRLYGLMPPDTQSDVDQLAEEKYKESNYDDIGEFQTLSEIAAQNEEAEYAAETTTTQGTLANYHEGEASSTYFEDSDDSNPVQKQIEVSYVKSILQYYRENAILLDLIDLLNNFPGAPLIARLFFFGACPRPALFTPSVFSFIKDLELPYFRGIDDITLPKLANPSEWLPKINDLLQVLFARIKQLIVDIAVSIIFKLFNKICDIIARLCDQLESIGQLASDVVNSGLQDLGNIIQDGIFGPDADYSNSDVENAIVDMLASFGLGSAAFANRELTLSFAESMANTMTQRELINAFLGKTTSDANAIISEIIDSEYPEFREALPNAASISEMFTNMGNVLPPAFKDSLNNLANEIPVGEEIPVNPSLCATQEQLNDFCEARASILQGRASPEQIAQLCDNQFNPDGADDLGDLQSILEKGIGEHIADSLPPVLSEPGCDNGLLPYESEEAIEATTTGIGNFFEILSTDYLTDMLGNGPLEKNWGLLNMMMSDTEGLPVTAHVNKTAFNPNYIDEYGTFFPDPKVVAAATYYSPPIGLALAALDQSRRKGVLPEKISAYLQYYMNGEIDNIDSIISVNYNNKIQETLVVENPYEGRQILSSPPTPFVSDTSYATNAEYAYEQGQISAIKITYDARKSENDLKLSFSDYARGYKQFGESEYEYGFDIEGFTAELQEDDGVQSNIYSDNIRIKISERINLAAKSYDKKTTPEPTIAEGIEINDDGEFEPSDSDPLSIDSESEASGDLDVVTTTKYQFLAIDDTFSEIESELEQYTNFQNCFASKKEQQPQAILLQEIIANKSGNSLAIDTINSYRKDTSETILQNIFEIIANSEADISAWNYGFQKDELTKEDLDYGINNDGTWLAYKDTDFIDEDMVLGISYDQFKNEIAGTPEKTRVFYFSPEDFKGTYTDPSFYIKSPDVAGWMGLINALFPDFSPCKPHNSSLIDFASIKQQVSDLYPNIPEDQRLKSDPDCIVEVPYNRVLERPAKASMIGLIISACRIFASVHVIKALPTFAKFSPKFPGVYSNLFSSYIIEDMKDSFKNAKGADWELFNGFSDEDFWYGFLEQCVQMYDYRVDIGDIDPPDSVLQALIRLNQAQEEYEYPLSRKDVRGDIGLFQTLKNYRQEKNLEAVKQTEDDAKIVMKEWINEQLNYISQKLITNLKNADFEPDVKDLNYYIFENLCAGSSLDINGNIDSDGNIIVSYVDLPTIPFEENDEVEEPYYTFGGQFVIKEANSGLFKIGQEYIGNYHVHLNEMGEIIYMVGEYHSDEAHDMLTPLSSIVNVPIGDIADLNSNLDYDNKPFLLEKYVSINGLKYSTTAASEKIASLDDLDQLISDVYPGTMSVVTNNTGQEVGITGELGVRYGLKFSCVIDEVPYEITSVEIDALDLPLREFKTLSANSRNLYCLINYLKNDPHFKMVSKYIVPVNKFVSLAAIYNDMAMLPAVGQLVAEKENLFDATIESKLLSTAGKLPEEVNTVLGPVDTTTLERYVGTWAHPDDRANRKGLFVLSWDNWNREMLINSTSRIKKMFKSYYNSRDFDITAIAQSTDSPGEIKQKKLKKAFNPGGINISLNLDFDIPWLKRRRLILNPFNSLGEVCKKEDSE